jgi:multiple sugar transport system permease protein
MTLTAHKQRAARQRHPEPSHGETARTSRGGGAVTLGAFRTGILAIWGLYFIIPVYWLVVAATKSQASLTGSGGLVLSHPQLSANLHLLFSYEGGIYLRWCLNSILYSVAGAGIGTVIAGLAGYYLAKYRFPGREAAFSFVIGAVLVPSTALALPLFLMFAKVHLTNTIWGILLASIVNPFGLYLARLAAESLVPTELLEAAKVDGAGDFKVFFRISSRLMGPGLVTIFLTQFVGIWNNFLLPVVMLQDQSKYPVTLGLYSWNSQISQAPILQTLVIVGAFVSITPLVIAFILLQRFWRSGLTTGGIKA